MPYRRRKRPSTRRRKRRSVVPWSRKKYCITPADAYTYARRSFSYLSGLVNSELFKYDTNATSQAIDEDSPYVLNLTAIGQGDNTAQRTGNSILARKLNIRMLFRQDNNQEASVRIMLVRDKQQVGDTAPTVADVLANTTMTSFLLASTAGRFDILYNRVITLIPSQSTQRQLAINKVMRSHVRYNGTATTDIQKNGLYLMIFSTRTSVEADGPVLENISTRLSYHDN